MCYAWPFFESLPDDISSIGGETEGETLTQETLIGASRRHHNQGWGTHNRGTSPALPFIRQMWFKKNKTHIQSQGKV